MFNAMFDRPSYCNQAEAIEAAAAQTAAQTPSDDSMTITHRASFVSAKALFCTVWPAVDGHRGTLRSSIDEARSDTNLRSTSSSHLG